MVVKDWIQNLHSLASVVNSNVNNLELFLGRHVGIINIQNTLDEEKRFGLWKLVKDTPQDISDCYEMNLGVQNYAIFMLIAKMLYRI
jgi:hypothetical protein